MHALYLLSVWLHILAATVWIGGMSFLVLVVVPWLRRGGRVEAAVFLRETGERFRNVGWSCFLLLAATGTFNLWVRGVRLSDFGRAEWLTSPFSKTVLLKLLVGLLRPTRGRVLFDNRVLTELADHELARQRLRFGFLFQGAALFDSLTVFDNVAFGMRELRRYSPDEISDNVRQRLQEVGLPATVARVQ